MSHCDGAREMMKRLWLEGFTASQIASAVQAEFGGHASRSAVIGLIHRMGVAERGDVPRKVTREKPERRRPPRAQAIPAVTVIESVPVSLLNSTLTQCHFPVWPHEDTGAPDFLVCGAEKGVAEGPYCAGHAHMARGTGGVAKWWNFR